MWLENQHRYIEKYKLQEPPKNHWQHPQTKQIVPALTPSSGLHNPFLPAILPLASPGLIHPSYATKVAYKT